jgi:thiosulfate dehydrogenase (quinone) large subunit
MAQTMTRTGFEEPALAKFIFSDPKMSIFWLVVRVYVGWQWLTAGWEKVEGSGWVGAKAGTSISAFVATSVKNASIDKPTVQPYYAWFLQHFVQPAPVVWSYAITIGEILVGLGLIFGLFTGIAAFFGGLMNVDYLLAGTVGTGAVNPPLFILATGLVLAWRVAGYIGLDFFVLPMVGVPGHRGKLFVHNAKPTAKLTPSPAH